MALVVNAAAIIIKRKEHRLRVGEPFLGMFLTLVSLVCV